MMEMLVRPFKIDIPMVEVIRLQNKLIDTRLPMQPVVPGAGKGYGNPLDRAHRLYEKLVRFDWLAVQEHLNRHQHYIASVEDQGYTLDIHFSRTISKRRNAIPLILIHGWPGSFYEFDKVVDRFANPNSPNDPAFHVIVPSCPGYCWSSRPPHRGWTQCDTARIFHKLMIGLGHTSYAVQAGDWGIIIAQEMAFQYTECKALHFSIGPAAMSDKIGENDSTSKGKHVQVGCMDWLDDQLSRAHALCMLSQPPKVGVALTRDPMGILMWVGERYHELSGSEFRPAEQNDLDVDILTTVSLYYFTKCIISPSLLYFENVNHTEYGESCPKIEARVSKPMGCTSFLYNGRVAVKRHLEKTRNLVFYNEIDEPVHFSALESPNNIVADCRKLFGDVFCNRSAMSK